MSNELIQGKVGPFARALVPVSEAREHVRLREGGCAPCGSPREPRETSSYSPLLPEGADRLTIAAGVANVYIRDPIVTRLMEVVEGLGVKAIAERGHAYRSY